MLKVFILGIFAIVFVSCASVDKPFYWEIEKDGETSHLLGTMHAGTIFDELPKYILEDHAQSKIIGVEVTDELLLSKEENRENIKKERNKQLLDNLKNKRSTKRYFTDQEWSVIEQVGRHFKVQEAQIQYYPPSAIGALVASSTFDRLNYGADPYIWKREGMDKTIFLRAREKGVEVIRFDREPALSAQCSDLVAVEGIKKTIAAKNQRNREYQRELEEMRAAYRRGDDAVLARSEKLPSDLERCLLIDRNKLWIPIIENAHSKKSKFFGAFGVLHLVGLENVLQLLEQRGFTVRRLSSAYKVDPLSSTAPL